MNDVYKFTKDVSLRSDCTMDSQIVGELAANANTLVSEITNGWYHTQNGWAYGYANSSTLIAVKIGNNDTKIEVGTTVKLTNPVTINGDAIAETDAIFIVTVVESAEKIQIKSGEKTYWVTLSSIIAYSTASSDVSESATAAATEKDKTWITSNTSTSSIVNTNTQTISAELNGLRVKSLKGIFGMPYQYMSIADRRIDDGDEYSSFGRKYAEKIVARIPLLILTPGTPEFLAGYDKDSKEKLVNYMIDLFGSATGTKSELDELLNGKGKYYGLKLNWTEYFNHVNPMCRAAAQIMGIGDRKYFDKELNNYSWQDNNNEEIHRILNYKGGMAFYINSDTQIGDSFSNSTGQSAIAGKVNGISEMGREINFLMGTSSAMAGQQFDAFGQEKALGRSQENKDSMTGKILGASGGSVSNLIGGIMSGVNTVIAGGKLIFPEIWNDSQFSRDYSVHLKLISPDCDDYSIYLNIIVPILHLVGFVCPRSVGPNGYVSPFLVRGSYKGLFNCDMGIISSMSITKGQEGSWTASGLPTIVDVNFTIKELYGTMAITTNKNISNGVLSNITLMDYIGNLCGVNINEPDLQRTAMFYYSQYFRNKFTDKVYTDLAGGMDQWATNKMMNLFRK